MNIFEEALNGLYECAVMCYDLDTADECQQILQKLVDKAISKQVRVIDGKGYCPVHDHRVYKGQKYCGYCGQALDWERKK